MSDGTSRLRFLDPTTFVETGTLEVHCDGRAVQRLNDLVVVGDEVLVNVHGQDRLARVLPDGRVAGWIDLRPPRELPGMRGRDQVANGVAWDPVRARLLVTGKHWPRLFEVVPPPAFGTSAASLSSGGAPPSHPTAVPALRVALHGSMGEVARADWDALAADDVLASHGWLATLESTRLGGGTPLCVAVYDGARLVGGAGCVLAVATDAVETLDHVLFGRLRPFTARLGLSLLPALVCVPSRGSGCHPLLARGLVGPARGRVLDLILDAIEGEAARRGVRACFADVHAGGELACRLRARSYLVATDTPTNVLDVAWDSFDSYLRHLDQITRGARKDVRRQITQNLKRGTTIVTLEEPELAADRLHELMTLNEQAHNGRPFGFSRDFFRVLRQQLGGDAVVYAARKGERITAVALLLRRGRTGHLPMVGVDHAAAGRDFTFFSIAHYRPITDAIADGMRTLYMGRALYDLKARRGCRVEDTQVFYRPSSRPGRTVLAAWFAVLSGWNRAKLAPSSRRRRRREPCAALN